MIGIFKFTLAALLIFVLVYAAILYRRPELETTGLESGMISETKTLSIGTTSLKVEVADTPEELIKGLSGRESFAPGTGLFFVFDEEDRHAIWMKDMRFPIDVLWFDAKFRVIHIVESMSPDSFPRTFSPNLDALYVLETASGFVAAHSIAIGDVANVQAGR